VRPAQVVAFRQGGQGLALAALGYQAACAVGQGGGGPAGYQAEQPLQGEQAALAGVARLVQPAAQPERAEGGIDGGGGLQAAAVAAAAQADLGGDLLRLRGLQGVEGVFQGGAAQGAGQAGEGDFQVVGGLGADGPGA